MSRQMWTPRMLLLLLWNQRNLGVIRTGLFPCLDQSGRVPWPDGSRRYHQLPRPGDGGKGVVAEGNELRRRQRLLGVSDVVALPHHGDGCENLDAVAVMS